MFVACNNNTREDENIVLKTPIPKVPTDSVTKEPTPVVENKNPEKEDPNSDKNPSYIAIDYNTSIPVEINEGEEKLIDLGVNVYNKYKIKLDRSFFNISFDFKCSAPCPPGITFNDEGKLVYKASFDDEGSLDINIYVSLRGYTINNEFGPLTINTAHMNQAPEISKINLIPLNIQQGLNLVEKYSCEVIKKDNDGDPTVNYYEWFVNGTKIEDSPGANVFTKNMVEKAYFKPGESVTCKAIVKDKLGAESEKLESNPLTKPNNLPSIDKAVLVVKKSAGAEAGKLLVATNENIEIDDEIGCYVSAQDIDGDKIYLNGYSITFSKGINTGIVDVKNFSEFKKFFNKESGFDIGKSLDNLSIINSMLADYQLPPAEEVSSSERILNTTNNGHYFPFLYKLKTTDAHKALTCNFTINDSSELDKVIKKSSQTLTIKNRPPYIKNIDIYKVKNTSNESFKSGEKIYCEAIIEDPDGDSIQQDISFINEKSGLPNDSKIKVRNLTLNLSQRIPNTENWLAKESYDLVPFKGTNLDPSTDIKNDIIYCRIDANDNYGGYATLNTQKKTLDDSTPTVYFVSKEFGAIIQSPISDPKDYIYGSIIDTKYFKIVDFDGDKPGQTSSIDVQKSNDYSIVPNSIVSSNKCEGFPDFEVLEEKNSTSSNFYNGGYNYKINPLSSGTISGFLNEHYNRACLLTIKPSIISDKSIVLKIKAPNRAPTISCSNTEQILDPSVFYDNYSWGLNGDPSEDVVCSLTDLDDPSILSSAYTIDKINDKCNLLEISKERKTNPFTFNFRLNMANMRDRNCSVSLQAKDGPHTSSLKSNIINVNFKPTFNIYFDNESFELDNSCRINYSFKSNEDNQKNPLLNSYFLKNEYLNDYKKPVIFSANNFIDYRDFSSSYGFITAKDTSKIDTLFGVYNKERNDYLRPIMENTYVFEKGKMNNAYSKFDIFNFDIDFYLDMSSSNSTLGSYDINTPAPPIITEEFQYLGASIPIKYDLGDSYKLALSKTKLRLSRELIPNIYNKYKTYPLAASPKEGWLSGQGRQVSITKTGCEDINDKRSQAIDCFGRNRANIGVGVDHACTTSGGTLWCWGSNQYEQVVSKLTSSYAPDKCLRKIFNNILDTYEDVADDCFTYSKNTTINDVKDFTLGDKFTCYIKNKKPYCFGSKFKGAIGRDDIYNANVDAQNLVLRSKDFNSAISDPSRFNDSEFINNISNITSGLNHVCALAEGGLSLYCWGDDSYGQLGLGGSFIDQLVYKSDLSDCSTTEPDKLKKCAYKPRGNAVVLDICGSNADSGSSVDSFGPCSIYARKIVNFPPKDDRILGLYAGGNNTCAILQSKKVVCWGDNTYGNLGTGESASYRNSPYDSNGNLKSIKLPYNVSSISVGKDLICAVTKNNRAYCWGNGQSVGLFNVSAKSVPPCSIEQSDYYYSTFGSNGCHTTAYSMISTDYYGLIKNISAVSIGSKELCTLTSDDRIADYGSVYCRYNNSLTPTNKVKQAVAVNSGSDFSCSVRSDKVYERTSDVVDSAGIYCWGNGTYGKLGVYDTSFDYINKDVDSDGTSEKVLKDTINRVTPEKILNTLPDIQFCPYEIKITPN